MAFQKNDEVDAATPVVVVGRRCDDKTPTPCRGGDSMLLQVVRVVDVERGQYVPVAVCDVLSIMMLA